MTTWINARPGQRVLLKDGRRVSYLGQDFARPDKAHVREPSPPKAVRRRAKPFLIDTDQIVGPA